jgi:hypothetical protein
VCDVEDTGSLEIPTQIATGLINLGYSGFPRVQIIRRAVASTTLPHGRVDLQIGWSHTLELSIPGLISCNDELPCPAGMTCQADMKCL